MQPRGRTSVHSREEEAAADAPAAKKSKKDKKNKKEKKEKKASAPEAAALVVAMEVEKTSEGKSEKKKKKKKDKKEKKSEESAAPAAVVAEEPTVEKSSDKAEKKKKKKEKKGKKDNSNDGDSTPRINTRGTLDKWYSDNNVTIEGVEDLSSLKPCKDFTAMKPQTRPNDNLRDHGADKRAAVFLRKKGF